MKFLDLIKIANRNLFRNKLRTFLTIMAIFVGSLTLIMTNGLGDGLRDYIENQVKNLEGNSVLFVRKKFEMENKATKLEDSLEYKEAAQDDAGNTVDPNSLNLSLTQIEAIAKDIPEVKSVTPRYSINAEYITLDGGKKYRLLGLGMLSAGVTQKTEAWRTIDGANQILIPLSLAKALSSDISMLIGKDATIAYKIEQTGEIKSMRLTIIGVATKGFMTNYNSFVDTDSARKIFEDQTAGTDNYNKFQSFTFQLNNSDEQTLDTVKNKLDEKGLAAESFADQKKRTYDGIGILQLGLNFFAFIALLAASFGIINTLIVAVMERTKEIGLQKALGMGRWTIFALFSLESVLIGFWGAMAGVVGGIFVGKITNFILGNLYVESFEGYSLFVFRVFSIFWVTLLICIIAFLAGVMPAFRASRLNPIDALRYE